VAVLGQVSSGLVKLGQVVDKVRLDQVIYG
jgi:hypothetical protein